MRLGIDAMGGDFAPENVVAGSINALKETSDLSLVLIGKEGEIARCLEEIDPRLEAEQSKRLHIVNTTQIIEMHETPTKAVLAKTDASITKGISLLKEGTIDLFASAGNTGAILASSLLQLGLMKGVLRPCLASFAPNFSDLSKVTTLLDVGANADCRPEIMLQFAIMGNILAQTMLKINKPLIKLLNIGEEETKGSNLYKETHRLLKNIEDLPFGGNIESSRILNADADVIVMDGFAGNIVLKMAESFYELAKNLLNLDEKSSSRFTALNYAAMGGAPILGITKPVVVGHGKSSPEAIKNMIKFSCNILQSELLPQFQTKFETRDMTSLPSL